MLHWTGRGLHILCVYGRQGYPRALMLLCQAEGLEAGGLTKGRQL